MPTPIKVLHIVDSMGGGGMENGVANLSLNLPRNGFDLHVCCLRSRGTFSERIAKPSQVYTLNKAPGLSFQCLRKLRKQILAVNPDIIHTHNLGPLIYTFFASYFGSQWKIVHGEHAELSDCELTMRRRLARKLMYRRCACVHSVSEQLTVQLRELNFNHGETLTIRNGVDTNKYAPPPDKIKAKQKLKLPKLPSNSFVIGAVGRFGKYKRHAMLVSAFDEFATSHKEAVLILAGDGGPEKHRTLQRIAECRNRGRIHWLGFLNDINRFYQGIDLLVSPSINEGMSNAILEAMACGVPVLANKACGNAEILSSSEGGILTAMDNKSALANILSTILKERTELSRKGTLAREAASKRFSIEEMTENYRKLYQQIADT